MPPAVDLTDRVPDVTFASLQAAFAQLGPVTVRSGDGQVLYANPAARELADAYADADIFDDSDLPFPDDEYPVTLICAGAAERTSAVLRYHRDGTDRWVLSEAAAVRGPSGTLDMVICTERDITASHAQDGQLHAVADTLQASLVPDELPEVAGIDLGCVFDPAGGVGGDFYDVFSVADPEWMVLIGDVCGKGADAAALTALCRYSLRALAMRERSPRALLSDLNEALIRHRGSDGRFATVALGRLRVTGRGAELTLALGGHPQPLVRRADGSVDAVGLAGTLVGAFPAGTFAAEQTVHLAPGDAVVLFTDGVTEARDRAGVMFDLAGHLAAAGPLGAQELADSIKTAVDAHQADAEHVDDVAVLVVAVPDCPVLHRRFPAVPASVPAVRRALEELAPARPRLSWDQIQLVVCELVTNSVKYSQADEHGDRWVDVKVAEQTGGTLRVTVSDPGGDFLPDMDNSEPTETSGRGFFLVSALSSLWGREPGAVPSCVWFESEPGAGPAPGVG